MNVLESHAFRVTRDAELAIQELEADDLLETIEQFVRRRRFGSVIRVTIDDKMPPRVRDILAENLELSETDIYEVRSPLGLSSLWGAGSIDRPELKYAPLVQSVPPSLAGLEGAELFAAIRHRDVLLHHPYDSFDPVVEFLRAAANDPDVLAIKQTLYRCGRNAPAVEQLMEAAANGKDVAVLVELKARFDEESNIGWAKALEREGAHVVYGLIGLKTHCKALQVVRREGDRIRRYTHLGTGNYNSVTTKQYTDLGYLTADDDIGADANLVFNHLTGGGQAVEYRKLLVAPVNIRQGIADRIDREIAHAEAGRDAHLIFKMNSLVDKPMIRKLYRASQAGVKVELMVRGMCCLRPGVPGVSENITEQSVVGRFLEHSRIYWFRNGGDDEVILGSADLMPRNLNRRVEILFPVQDKGILRRIRDEILPMYMNDNMKTRVLGSGRQLDARLARRGRGVAQRAGVVRGAGARAGRGRERARLMKVYFLRHGKAENRSEWRGRDADRPLTPEGEEALRRECKVLLDLDLALDLIVTSPLARARRTAEIVAEDLGAAGQAGGGRAAGAGVRRAPPGAGAGGARAGGRPHGGRARARLQRDRGRAHRRRRDRDEEGRAGTRRRHRARGRRR